VEVVGLDDERMAFEEGHDVLFLGDKTVDRERPHAAVRTLRAEPSASEHAHESFEHDSIPLMLVDVKDGLQLPPACRHGVGVPVD